MVAVHGRDRVSFETSQDACLNIFAAVYPQHFDIPLNGKVLEVGCAEANWIDPMHAVRPDLSFVGIDWRGCSRKHGLILAGDVLQATFEPESFDAVVFISSLEHIGLGHYNDDPLDVDGDTHALVRAQHWLKHGGLMYADVPWNPDPGYDDSSTDCRIYDDHTINTRLTFSMPHLLKRWQGWTTIRETSTLIPRPLMKTGDRFFYCATVWQKV